jgi:hypothetical protein
VSFQTLRATLLRRHQKAKRSSASPQDSSTNLHHHHHQEGGSLDKSHVGMFFGFLVLTGCVVCIILFFYWYDNGSESSADLTFFIMDFILKFVMLVAVVMATKQTRCLGYSREDDNTIDHILLLLSFAGLFLLEFFTLIISKSIIFNVEVTRDHVFNSVNVVFAVIQGVVQTVFLIDGMQRHALNDEQVREKPGRGCITFLIAANVATWLFKTIQEKKLFGDDGSEFYGEAPWAIMLNTSLPLLLFFRFHSSICFAHMWHAAYHKKETAVVAEVAEPNAAASNGRTIFDEIYEESESSFDSPL